MSIRFRRLFRSNSSTSFQKRFKKCPAQFCNVSSSKKHRCRKARESTHSFIGIQMPDRVRRGTFVPLDSCLGQYDNTLPAPRAPIPPDHVPSRPSLSVRRACCEQGWESPTTHAGRRHLRAHAPCRTNASSPYAQLLQLLWLSAVPSVGGPGCHDGRTYGTSPSILLKTDRSRICSVSISA